MGGANFTFGKSVRTQAGLPTLKWAGCTVHAIGVQNEHPGLDPDSDKAFDVRVHSPGFDLVLRAAPGSAHAAHCVRPDAVTSASPGHHTPDVPECLLFRSALRSPDNPVRTAGATGANHTNEDLRPRTS